MDAVSNQEAVNQSLRQQNGTHLGDIVGWNQYGSKNRQTVEDALMKYGLADDVDMPKVTALSAYRRTVARVARGGSRDSRVYEIVKIEDNETRIVHAVVRKDIVTNEQQINGESLSNKDADFATETKFAFNKEGYTDGRSPETLFRFQHEEHPLAKEAKQMYDNLCVVYTADDLRTGFQRAFMKWGGLRLLDKGGAWWVPSSSATKVRDWNSFMREMNNTTMVLPLFDTPDTVKSLRELTKESLEGQLEELFKELNMFSGKDNTRLSTLEKRIEAFDEMRDKAELYERLLGHKLTEIKTKVTAASASLCESIKGMR